MRTEFEKTHWEQALSEIPFGAKLVSVQPTTCRVDMIGIFYKMPKEKANNYMRAMTPMGRSQAKALNRFHLTPSTPPQPYIKVKE